jgi:hypothetical protein
MGEGISLWGKIPEISNDKKSVLIQSNLFFCGN